MRKLEPLQFNEIIKEANVKPRLRRELRFTVGIRHLEDNWSDCEIVSITDRSGSNGILLLEPDDVLYVISYTLSRNVSSSKTGRSKPIICGFCNTWQAGSNAATITFSKDKRTNVGYLCCADLACSDHVRSKTQSSAKSRVHLREDLTDEQRVERLKKHLRSFIKTRQLDPVV